MSPDEPDAYVPAIIDTSEVELPASLDPLVDRLAANVHEQWAVQRLDEGWRYGPARDDVARRHPCLVPFEALDEREKETDRRIAIETLRAIVALGYEISPVTLPPEASRRGGVGGEARHATGTG